ncbi:MAG: VWA domain-containing protein, partial [Planctomycetes bacterium]|nr:VWA domain-containing protein [Planctomycetota bacterium]
VLLAVAFMQPYWHTAEGLSIDSVRARRVAILLDTSASMRRGDLWSQAKAQVEQVLDGLEPVDDVALFTFDGVVRPMVGFDEADKMDPQRKAEIVRGKLAELGPSWAHTDLGTALVSVGETLDVAAAGDASQAALQIIVISDVQQGSNLNTLQTSQWPERVHVEVRRVSLPDNSNARVGLIAFDDEDAPGGEPRVRVTNASDSGVEQFQVAWADESSRASSADGVAFYVPPGQSRAMRVPRPVELSSADRIVLHGDEAFFDNTYYVVPIQQQEARLAYIGSDAPGDAQGPRHYLQTALGDTPRRKIVFTSYAPDRPLPLVESELPHLVVVADEVSQEQREAIATYVKAGGRALVVLSGRDMAVSLGDLLSGVDVQPQPSEAGDDEYAMLGEIDFTHPVFAPFAGARYNDFTKIRFWHHRRVTIETGAPIRLVAHFDNDDPAMWEHSHGEGKVFVLASGWHPQDSQLSRSSKFVPLLVGLLEQGIGQPLQSNSYVVGDVVPLPTSSAASDRTVLKPDGSEAKLSEKATVFDGTDQPGIYRLQTGGDEHLFAVNVATAESDTAVMNIERLEQLGVTLGQQQSQSEEYDRLRQLRDRELEGRQKIWKWLIVAALFVLGLETIVAGRSARQTDNASKSRTG